MQRPLFNSTLSNETIDRFGNTFFKPQKHSGMNRNSMTYVHPLLFALLLVTTVACDKRDRQRSDGPQVETEVTQQSQRNIDAGAIRVPEGTSIASLVTGLSYPVGVTFDDKGTMYIAEAGGHTYGTKPGRASDARILQRQEDGKLRILYDNVVPMDEIKSKKSSADMEEGLIPPVTGITYYDGKLYISHRSRYSTYDLESGEFKTIINGLPSWGEFLNAKPVFHNDEMYFFLSTQGNTGVIEEHWVHVIDEFKKSEAREIPGEDITLTGQNFWVPTKKATIVEADSVETGAYAALGEKTQAGQVIKGEKICNGAFFKCDPDGANIERICWGLRSSFGYAFSPEGKLIATMNSANPMPPRGLYFDYEPIYEIVSGEWYGWPDFFSGIPITDERFSIKKEERAFVLTPQTHRKLLKGKSRPRQPIAKLGVHTAAQGMVFGRSEFGIDPNNILVAEFGSIVPEFKDDAKEQRDNKGFPSAESAPDGVQYNWPGFKVQQVDLRSGRATDYIVNKDNRPASVHDSGGLERPIQLEWGPDGSLYIVDFGVVEFDAKGMNAHPFTGVIWKLTKQELR